MRSNFGYRRYSFIAFPSSCRKFLKKCKSKAIWSRFIQSFKSLSPSEKALFAEWSGQLPILVNDVALFAFNAVFSLSAKDLLTEGPSISSDNKQKVVNPNLLINLKKWDSKSSAVQWPTNPQTPLPQTLTQPPPALIWPTNLPWFKQTSKGWFYQFNSRFLLKINF